MIDFIKNIEIKIFSYFLNADGVKILLPASLRNFGHRVSEFFTRKKKDASKEVEEAESKIEKAVDQQVDKTAEATEELKKDAEHLGQDVGKIFVILQ